LSESFSIPLRPSAPQPQVIKLKNCDTSFKYRDRAGTHFRSPSLTPRAACECAKTDNRAAAFPAAVFVWQRRQGFLHDQSQSGFHVFIRDGQLY
jgi:hypothetical protein